MSYTKNLLLPFYHMVSNQVPTYVKHLYKPRTVNQFKADLDYFLANYQPISLTDVIAVNQGKNILTKPSFHLTFDDGLSNFYDVIAPILKEKNIPATVFLNSSFVDNKDLFYRYKMSLLLEHFTTIDTEKEVLFDFMNEIKQRNTKKEAWKDDVKFDKKIVSKSEFKIADGLHFLKEINYFNRTYLDQLSEKSGFSFSNFLATEKPYLTLAQIKELQQQGFTFGAHSVDHPMYNDIYPPEQIAQTLDSLKWLNKNIQPKHKAFAFPFHDIDISKQFFNTIEHDVEITFGTSGFKDDVISFNLQRLDMEKTNESAKNFIKKELLKRKVKSIFGMQKISRL